MSGEDAQPASGATAAGLPERAPKRWITAALAFVVLLSVLAAGRVDDVLRALHKPGQPSAGIGDVASFDAERGEAAVAAWAGASPQYVARWQLVFHLLLVVALPFLLGHLLRDVRAWDRDRGAHGLRRVAGFAIRWAVGLAVLFGVLQTWALWRATQSRSAPDLAFEAPAWLQVGWLLSVGALALLLAMGWMLRAVANAGGERSSFLQAVSAIRLQIAVVLMFTFLLHGPIAGEQAADVMLRWVEPGASPWAGILGVGLAACLSLVVLAAADSLVRKDQQEWRGVVPPLPFVVAGALVLIVGLIGWRAEQLSGLVWLGGALLVYGAVAWLPAEPRSEDLTLKTTPVTGALPVTVAAVPLVALGLAIQSAALAEYVYADLYDDRLGILVLIGVVVQLLGWGLVGWDPRGLRAALRSRGWLDDRSERLLGRVTLGAAVAVSVVVVVAVLVDPWWTGDTVGTVGVFAVFSIVTAVVAYLVALPEQRWTPPPVLAALGVKRRIPILLGLVAWLVASSFQDDHGYHEARLVDGPRGEERAEVDVQGVWTRWLARNREALIPGLARRQSVPLVFVAATGGGVRAAYWTARGLELVTAKAGDGSGRDRLFALSGASGGSVGHAFFIANARAPRPARRDWVQRRLGRDFLGPTWAWTLFADVPQAFLHLNWKKDRAAVLEGAWERSLDGLKQPIRASWSSRRDEPLMLLNSTTVEEGCRLNVSPLAADGQSPSCLSVAHDGALAGTEDLTDVLCPADDLRLSTAAMMSARFPFVTPSGALNRCTEKKDGTVGEKGTEGTVRGVDGGYFDNTAASPVSELYPAIARRVASYNAMTRGPCIRPVLIQLDNTYEQAVVPVRNPRPFEPAVPLLTMFKVVGIGPGREASNRQAAAHLFGKANYARMYPVAHPGTTPPLGWTLSRISMDDMDQEYGGGHNAGELERIGRWLKGGEGCDG